MCPLPHVGLADLATVLPAIPVDVIEGEKIPLSLTTTGAGTTVMRQNVKEHTLTLSTPIVVLLRAIPERVGFFPLPIAFQRLDTISPVSRCRLLCPSPLRASR